MEFAYFDIEHAIDVHDEIILKTGGVVGIINLGLLESCLEHIQYDLYYPTFEEKLTHLFYTVNKNHSFNDGNKRSCIALSAYFLEINGLGYLVPVFMERMENIAVYVAKNQISKGLLLELITSIVYEEDYSEELKLKLYRALTS